MIREGGRLGEEWHQELVKEQWQRQNGISIVVAYNL